MITNSILINNLNSFLNLNDAINLECCSKFFRNKPKYRYFSSYSLIKQIFMVSKIKFSHIGYNQIYNLLNDLCLLDFSIFIVGSNVNFNYYLSKINCNLRNIFQSNDNYYYTPYSYDYSVVDEYVSIISKLLNSPSIIIKNYLAITNPDYFTKKYKISCKYTKNYNSFQKIHTNIMVVLQNILPQQLWKNDTIYYCILCKDTDEIHKMNYLKNPIFNLLLQRFHKLINIILYNSFNKLKLIIN